MTMPALSKELPIESKRRGRAPGAPSSLFFGRVGVGERLPQRLAAIDDLLATAFRALIFAHVAAGEGGALDLVHFDGAIGAGGVGHRGYFRTWRRRGKPRLYVGFWRVRRLRVFFSR